MSRAVYKLVMYFVEVQETTRLRQIACVRSATHPEGNTETKSRQITVD